MDSRSSLACWFYFTALTLFSIGNVQAFQVNLSGEQIIGVLEDYDTASASDINSVKITKKDGYIREISPVKNKSGFSSVFLNLPAKKQGHVNTEHDSGQLEFVLFAGKHSEILSRIAFDESCSIEGCNSPDDTGLMPLNFEHGTEKELLHRRVIINGVRSDISFSELELKDSYGEVLCTPNTPQASQTCSELRAIVVTFTPDHDYSGKEMAIFFFDPVQSKMTEQALTETEQFLSD